VQERERPICLTGKTIIEGNSVVLGKSASPEGGYDSLSNQEKLFRRRGKKKSLFRGGHGLKKMERIGWGVGLRTPIIIKNSTLAKVGLRGHLGSGPQSNNPVKWSLA